MIEKPLNPGNRPRGDAITESLGGPADPGRPTHVDCYIMTRICVVKQHTTYDLFTRTGPDLQSIVASSNWRSGPIGLWEAFDTSARIVFEDAAPECQLGKQHWSQYVQGWDLWPPGSTADDADLVDWAQYDIVISIDVAVPTRIIKRFPSVLWCYYFIEGGPTGIDNRFRGSPFFSYNVFLNHRLAKSLLTSDSPSSRQMRKSRRAVLDFPYYMQSPHSVRRLYPQMGDVQRTGVCLSHHSREVLRDGERAALTRIGPVRAKWRTIAEIHRAELESTYFVVHPASKPSVGVALIEAVSAGCVVLAPNNRVLGFPELLTPSLEYRTMDELLELLESLENDPRTREGYRRQQERLVEEWCYRNPAHNLEMLLGAFRSSSVSPRRQLRAERQSRVLATVETAGLRGIRRARRTLGMGFPSYA